MSIRPKKEEKVQNRISNLYGYCQDNLFRASKNAVAKHLGEQPAEQEAAIPKPSWIRGKSKKKDNREDR